MPKVFDKNKKIALLLGSMKNAGMLWIVNSEKKEVDEEPLILSFNNHFFYCYSTEIKEENINELKNYKIFSVLDLDYETQKKLIEKFDKLSDRKDFLYKNILLRLKAEELKRTFFILNYNALELRYKDRRLLSANPNVIQLLKDKWEGVRKEIRKVRNRINYNYEKVVQKYKWYDEYFEFENKTKDLLLDVEWMLEKIDIEMKSLSILSKKIFEYFESYPLIEKVVESSDSEKEFRLGLKNLTKEIVLDADELAKFYCEISESRKNSNLSLEDFELDEVLNY